MGAIDWERDHVPMTSGFCSCQGIPPMSLEKSRLFSEITQTGIDKKNDAVFMD